MERDRGADVVAVTLKLWADERTDGTQACCSPEAVRGARSMCHSLGIPHLTLDLEDAFRSEVVSAFVDGYRAGETPNPCVICNGDLRIDAMVALADRVGASALATGHYARIADDGAGPLLKAAADPAKDQTYMLSGLRPATLARLRFPLGELTKPEVRRLAEVAGLAVASKRESQDLCFLAGEGKRSFLERHGGMPDRPGQVVSTGGDVVGEHPGHHHFTVGQRRGLGLATGTPVYVDRRRTQARTRSPSVAATTSRARPCDSAGHGCIATPPVPGRSVFAITPTRSPAGFPPLDLASTRSSSSSSPSPPTASRLARRRASMTATS